MSSVFSNNLRRLRQSKGYTQEQVADHLGVSPQSVSRWECGNTLPDIMLLPEIARLYGVIVDDMYREDAKGYANYAQRLVAVYEASRKTEDFLLAEQEFSRIPPDALTAEDLRGWGVIYHYMTKYCASHALQKLDQAMAHPERSDDTFCSAAQQKAALLCDLGRGKEEAARYESELAQAPTSPHIWLLCAAAHHFTNENERALEVALEGIERFPDHAVLHVYAGDILCALKRYDEAFPHWQQALTLDPELLAAAYSMGFCYEDLGQYAEACKIWAKLANTLDLQGFPIEAEEPRKKAEECRAKINANN